MTKNGLYVVLTIVCFVKLSSSTPVNVALNKKTKAIFTCSSFGREYYRDLSNKDRTQKVNLCSDVTVHPPAAMVDGDVTTKWQSVSKFHLDYYGKSKLLKLTPPGLDKLHGIIYIDLKQVFNVESMSLKMGDAKRPYQMVIYKSTTTEDAGSYKPWVYRVTADVECQTKFSYVYSDTPTSSTGSTCTRYNNPTATNLETITFDFKHVTSPALREWKKARYIKIELYDMPMPLGFEGNMFQHFAISEWVVMAECVCNGHQTGCDLNPETSTFECQCGGNTFGSFCELCKPMFNQKPFGYGIPCESCNCFNHATECSYDAAVAAASKSLNLHGVRSGGGVCSGCKNHTAGINCELCAPTYYRPAGRAQTALEACVPCVCSSAGSVSSPLSQVKDDCVMNSDVVLNPPKDPGSCWCKTNVEGNKCDRCKAGFYNLMAENFQGCQACNCNNAGTMGRSQICATDKVGQCPCKVNVQGRACDVCKDGFYNLDLTNAEGCSACTCDPGGAVTPLCQKTLGQCTCRPHLIGRQCDNPREGFYNPDLHFISSELEQNANTWAKDKTMGKFYGDGYAVTKNGDRLAVTLSFPGGTTLSGTCTVVIRYKSNQATSLTVQIMSSDDPLPTQVTLPTCPTTGKTWCYAKTKKRNFTLNPGPHETNILVSGAALLDQVVCLPMEFINAESVLKSTDFTTNCDVLKNDMRVGTGFESMCKKGVFSLTTNYLNGPRSCSCNAMGSFNSICDKNGGQCRCKPGVGGRQCDTCLADFYNLTPDGCQACDCKGSNSVCDKLTGQCPCPSNTIGRQCDKCAPYYYGWNSVTGCLPCNCNSTGSNTLQCQLNDGRCLCKNGVVGQKCSQCADGFTGFGFGGCSPCSCSAVGAVNTICNKLDGQCPCRVNVESKLCTSCKVGSFYLEKQNPKGCLDCICMGVVNRCSSSLQSQQRKAFLLAQSSAGQLSTTITLADNAVGLVNSVNISVRSEGDGRLYLDVDMDGMSNIYWKMPPELQGNLLKIYGSKIVADMSYSSGTPLATTAVLIGRNNVRLVHTFDPLQATVIKPLTVSLMESQWKVEGTLAAVTRGKFLLIISDTKMILFPAKQSNTAHKTSLSRLEYSVVGSTGLSNPAVEQCQCGPQYTGLSCETCAAGFKRANVTTHQYLGTCIPCDCHGHASTCDPNTGVCLNCLHDTTGNNCEVCKVGFYGDATKGTAADCSICPCFDPRVINKTCSVVNGNVKCSFCKPGYIGNECNQCDHFYYGNPKLIDGTCTKCDCNGNSELCGTATGICQNCQHDTVGPRCERCRDGFYGAASQQNCAACGCDAQGSSNLICNFTSGECQCHPGVGNRICDACQTNFYGFKSNTFIGCKVCGCDEKGSSNLQCMPDSGVCLCKPNVVPGGKCSQCSPGFFGLPDKQCEACQCNPTGSVGGTAAVCDVGTGACPCKPGVTGRACDKCKLLYTGFGNLGCTACGKCEFTLGEDTKRLSNLWTGYYNTSQDVVAIQTEDKVLQSVQKQLTDTLTKLGISGSTSGSVDVLTNNITESETNSNKTVTDLLSKAVGLETAMVTLNTSSKTESDRINVLMKSAQDSLDNIRMENQKAFNYEYRLKQYNASAVQLRAQGQVTGNLGLDFETEKQKSSADLKTIQDDTRIDTMQSKVMGQATSIGNLVTKADSLKKEYSSVVKQISDEDKKLDELISQQTTITTTVVAAKQSKDKAAILIAEIQKSHDSAENITTNTEKNLQTVLTTKSACDAILTGNVLDALPQLSPLPTGIINLQNGSVRLSQELIDTRAQLDSAGSLVVQAENKANNLQVQAGLINSTFQGVENRGNAAVSAIKNFEQVISTLESSTATSVDANKTIQNARAFLSGVTISKLESDASTSKLNSEQLLSTVNSIKYEPEVLQSLLTSGKTSLQLAKDKWTIVDQQLKQMDTAANTLTTLKTENTVQQKITTATDIATQAENLAKTTKTSADAQQLTLVSKKQEVDGKKGQLIQTNNLIAKVEVNLRSLQSRVNTVNNNIILIQNIKAEILNRRTQLDSKMATIEAKLAEAKRILGKIKQPIHFNGNMSVVANNNAANFGLPYNDVNLDFRKDGGSSSELLFFSENSASPAHLTLKLVNGKVVFGFDNGNEFVAIQNPAEICDKCWAHVLASRYENTGHLTVTLIGTGQFASRSSTGSQTSRTLTLNSKLMFGQLQDGYQTIKYTGGGFKGCMQNTKFNGEEINIWSEAILSEKSPQCCRRLITVKPSLPAGTKFDGFSYLVLRGDDTTMSQHPIMMSIQFRTFSPTATLLSIANSDRSVFYTIYLNNGYIVIEYGKRDSGMIRATSNMKHNNGQWMKVTAQHQALKYQLSVMAVDPSNTANNEDISLESQHTVDLSALSGLDLVLGTSNHPNEVGYKVDSKNYGGCLKQLQYKFGDGAMVTRSLSQKVVMQKGVSFDGCAKTVLSGMSFTDPDSYSELKLSSPPSSIKTLKFNLITSEPHGVILYLKDPLVSTRVLYLGLFHGNLILVYNQASVSRTTTHGLYLSDGQEHQINIDFSQFRARLTVDGLLFEQAGASNPLTQPQFDISMTTPFYIGGSKDNSVLNKDYPARKSLIGSLRLLYINGGKIDLSNAGTVVSHNKVDLSGVAAPPSDVLPPPYTTVLPPTTLPPPTCASPTQPTFQPEYIGTWFKGNGVFVADISTKEFLFLGNFAMSITFEAFHPNGLLLFVADSYKQPPPTQWLAIFLKDGKVVMDVKGKDFQETLTSGFTYNDGKQHRMDFLVMYRYLVLVEPVNKEYVSNSQDELSKPAAFTSIKTDLLLGGIDTRFPFDQPALSYLPSGFVGAIYKCFIKVNEADSNKNLEVDWRKPKLPLQPGTTGQIPTHAYYGLSLDGVNSYAKLSKTVSMVNNQLTVKLNFTSTQASTNLFNLYSSRNQFVILELSDYRLKVIISNGQPFTVILYSLSSMCDGVPHHVTMVMMMSSLTIQIDNTFSKVYPYISGFTPPPITNREAYFGGFQDVNTAFSENVVKESLRGCLLDIVVNGDTYDPNLLKKTSRGSSYACPY